MRRIFLGASFLIMASIGLFFALKTKKIEEPIPAPESAYAEGYERGYRALMEQMGQELPAPPPKRSVKYLSMNPEEKEETLKGYVDGYHTAADVYERLNHCPRE